MSDDSEISECDTAIAAASFVIATLGEAELQASQTKDTSRNELEPGKRSISPREMTT